MICWYIVCQSPLLQWGLGDHPPQPEEDHIGKTRHTCARILATVPARKRYQSEGVVKSFICCQWLNFETPNLGEESPNKEGAICASNGSYQNATHETIKRHGLLRDTCSLLHLSCLPAQPSLVQVANVGPPLQKDHQLTSSGFAFRNTETCSAQNLKTAVRTASAPANAFKAKDGG